MVGPRPYQPLPLRGPCIPLTMNQNPKVLIHRRRKNLIRTTRAIKTVKSYILKYYDEYRLIEMHLIGD